MLTYVLLIGLLLFPLSYYSQPATVASRNEPAGAGGRLARLREEYKLGQADLGEIDPAGETMKLATLGMRCVAAAMLWHQANEAKKKEDWTGTWTKLDQLAKLEPNYIGVWRFQAWNVSYNIAVEFDDYRVRYFWIKEGIKFLQKGSRYNREEHRLISDIGTDTGRKIGVADEKLEYRKLFHDDIDPEFPDHDNVQGNLRDKPRTQAQRDNWLVGKEYYEKAIDIWDNRSPDDKRKLVTINPVLLYSEPAKAQINYADALEQDGRFGDIAREAWGRALELWNEFGLIDIAAGLGRTIHLADQERLEADSKQLKQDLDALDPGLRERIAQEKKATLTEDDRKLIEAGPGQMSPDQQQSAYATYMKTQVSNQEVADRIKGDKAAQARDLVQRLTLNEGMVSAISSDRETVNFAYWRLRCQVERSPAALEGRRLMYQAHDFYHNDTDLPRAKEAYEKSFAQWRIVFDEFPDILGDAIGGESMVDAVMDYHEVLRKLEILGPDGEFPEDFILRDLVDILKKRGQFGAPPAGQGRPPGAPAPPPGSAPPGT
ncbi:MAG TPA: hypothetical protein VMV69_26895 [Pirellulales bacterium]|nr:hypothetical protein [Pirellulales bacterium]